jgi:hypothetical protein
VKNITFLIRSELLLGVSENRVLRRIFGAKREEVIEAGDNCMRTFIISTLHQILLM